MSRTAILTCGSAHCSACTRSLVRSISSLDLTSGRGSLRPQFAGIDQNGAKPERLLPGRRLGLRLEAAYSLRSPTTTSVSVLELLAFAAELAPHELPAFRCHWNGRGAQGPASRGVAGGPTRAEWITLPDCNLRPRRSQAPCREGWETSSRRLTHSRMARAVIVLDVPLRRSDGIGVATSAVWKVRCYFSNDVAGIPARVRRFP
jgi:hypothetical protein